METQISPDVESSPKRPVQRTDLDLMRSVAALLVVGSHARALLFVNWQHVEHKSVVLAVLYGATGLGHQAVMIFFVLSGYLVGGSVLRGVRRGSWSWRGYLVRRGVRLYAVLLPALLLGTIWDVLGVHLYSLTGAYTGAPTDAILPYSVESRLDASHFVGSALFLQTIALDPYGSNSPLWSLANEWWYYILFPLLLVAIVRSRRSATVRALCIALALVIAYLVGAGIRLYFLVWLMGVIVASNNMKVRWSTRRWGIIAACVLAFLTAMLSVSRGWHPSGFPASDFAIGLATAALIQVLLMRPETRIRSGLLMWTSLAGFSYTLYLVHLPVLVFFRAFLRAQGVALWQPTSVLALFSATAVIVVVVSYAWLVSKFTEARTDSYRRVTDRLIDRFPHRFRHTAATRR